MNVLAMQSGLLVTLLLTTQLTLAADDSQKGVPANSKVGASAEMPSKPRILWLRFRNDTIIRRKEFSGDNWHTTWAADGNQYVLQCDGRGYNTRMWRLVGQPPDFRFEPVAAHPGPKEPPPRATTGSAFWLSATRSITTFRRPIAGTSSPRNLSEPSSFIPATAA